MQRCIILASKIKELIKNVLPTDSKKVKIIVAIGLIGIVLILASEMFENDSSKQEVESDSISYEEYTAQLENRLTELISSIDGVGQCQVMITLENTTESVYATDIEIKNDDSSLNEKNEYVIYDSDDGETPVLIKEYLPKVQGVTVVCSGGDNTAVREKIIESVTSLFNISTNRISVSKIKS
jgi:stage III sporulation protein AG